ncbi:LGFP repeat-containing protein [Agromyces sp. MMS24-K17]|uniref:LGFP repeat-containing protein n=1 Tax=Agromyces sp. MMS24-K17 TaxID=3372850 RepID=UPI0037544282
MHRPDTLDRPPRSVSWAEFRDAIRYGADPELTSAVPEIAAKRAQYRPLGAALAPHAALRGSEGYRREYEHGVIVWTRRHGAAVLHGMIRDVWELLGAETSKLGAPVGDLRYDGETGTWHGGFEGGRVDWAPATGPIVSFG